MHDDATNPSRRKFLATAGLATGATLLPETIQKALAIPAARVTGTLDDVQHVVILMQENRSFDHYFGTMRGVQGFGDRHPIPLPSGKNVWFQRSGTEEVLPFHLDTKTTTAMRVPGTPHTWPDAQLAWDQGRLHEWPLFKNDVSMGYYQPDDVPFQRALAESFTVCDANHCSIQTGTLPNRVVFMTGTNYEPGRTKPGTSQVEALIDNQNNRGAKFGLYNWKTYPERLEEAGVSWRIYQDPQDNWTALLAPWESFTQYKNAQPGSPLFEKAMTHWPLTALQEHVTNGTLPQVSWVIPSPVWSEHPSASSPLQGASYTQQVLDILVSNPELWSKTVFIVTFDENDGLFDHVPPPAVPSLREDGSYAGKTTLTTTLEGEYYTNEIGGETLTRPYGMGPRVPMYIVSPWSRGGWVDSQVFDHTSTIRFLEKRFGVQEPNITPWHRAVSGDLTSCFDFAHPDRKPFPELPDMSAATGENLVIEGLPPVTVPANQTLPKQETGVRYKRALPYVLHTRTRETEGELELTFDNDGRQGAVFHVYDHFQLSEFPRRYTVEAGKSLVDRLAVQEDGRYELQVIAPNGFARYFAGQLGRDTRVLPEVRLKYIPLLGSLELISWNVGTRPVVLKVTPNAYRHDDLTLVALPFALPSRRLIPIRASGNWYDFTVTAEALPGWSRRFAGYMENGRDGVTDPALGR